MIGSTAFRPMRGNPGVPAGLRCSVLGQRSQVHTECMAPQPTHLPHAARPHLTSPGAVGSDGAAPPHAKHGCASCRQASQMVLA